METKPKVLKESPTPSVEEFERTLVVVKPDAISKIRAIEYMIRSSGLFTLHRRRMYLKPEQARDFYIRSVQDEEAAKYFKLYKELIERDKILHPNRKNVPVINISDFEDERSSTNMDEFVDFMTSGPIEVFVIAGRGAANKLIQLVGPDDPKVARETNPDSIRAKFGGETNLRNAVYCSSSPAKAEKDIRFFFPDSKFDAECKLGVSGEYLSKAVNPILLKGLIQLCRQKPDNPLVWLADWLLANNPNSKT
ncbi:nucleoside diphosphate kinase homolog 5-like [Uloborus diversus]|uniref:nucleoside diphosphate kinase homolog 5-like n=1 Tax=Uloborus diversus TaxID=327109 RepID=UPI0024092414|nr:nucleoside diphosphate kinase homolog 5-like [Uloborus diversus]